MREDGLLDNALARGEQIMAGLRKELAGLQGVMDIRGAGLMIGIELDRPCPEVVALALREGLVLNVTADTVVRLLPPLILDAEQADIIVSTLSAIIRRVLA
jgi:acetylornithine aminotransferase